MDCSPTNRERELFFAFSLSKKKSPDRRLPRRPQESHPTSAAKMARVVELFKDLVAKNIREPKGIAGRVVLVSDK